MEVICNPLPCTRVLCSVFVIVKADTAVNLVGPIPSQPQTMTATRYTMMATAMKTRKTNGVLLRNRQIHDIIGQVMSLSSWFVAVIVKPI